MSHVLTQIKGPFFLGLLFVLFRSFFVTRHFDIMTNFICDRYNLNHASGNNSYVILGRDGSGVVTQVGADVFQVQPGDRVWFAIPPCFQVHTFTTNGCCSCLVKTI